MIEKVRIRNFKSLQDVSVELSPVTVLIGKSGTGKSNFVDAMRFLRDVLRCQKSEGLPAHFRPVPLTNELTSFELVFRVNAVDQPFNYRLDLHWNQGTTPFEEKLSSGETVLYHQMMDKNSGQNFWITEPRLVQVPKPGKLAISRLPSLSDVVLAYTALTQGIGCYVFGNSVMTGESSKSQEFGFADDGSNFLPTMKGIISNLHDISARKKIVAALKRVNDSTASVELDNLQNPQDAIVGHQLGDRTLDISLSQESEGFRRFYAHLLALYQRPPKLLMLFEHPEDGIHPGVLSLLAEEFEAAPSEGRGQIVLTTHSPSLLDCFAEDQIRVVEKRGFYTTIGRLSEDQKQALNETLLNPGELLTVDPARCSTEMGTVAEL